MGNEIKLSIIIPNWLTHKGGRIVPRAEAYWFLKHCIRRIKAYTTDFELIIIDNGSITGSKYMEREADTYIRNDKNMGFAVACNQGFVTARGEYVCSMNNDIFVWPGWAEAMYKTYDEVPTCGVVMPAVMKQTKDGRVALTIEKPDMENEGKYGLDAEFGSLWMIKRKFLEQIREKDGYYFDENFKMGFGEDRDMWRRVRREGKRTVRTHNTRVFHQGNVTICKLENRKQYTLPNREYLKKKWGY